MSVVEKIRTTGRVLWSPLLGDLKPNEFVDLVIRDTKSLLDKTSKLSWFDQELKRLLESTSRTDRVLYERYIGAVSQIHLATQVYLEIIPDRRGNSTWDAVFPHNR